MLNRMLPEKLSLENKLQTQDVVHNRKEAEEASCI